MVYEETRGRLLHQPVYASNFGCRRSPLRPVRSDPSHAISLTRRVRTCLSSPDRAIPTLAFRESKLQARSFRPPLPPPHNRRRRGFVATCGARAPNHRRSECFRSYDLHDRAGHTFESDALITQSGFHYHGRHTINDATAFRFREHKSALGFDPRSTLLAIRSHAGHHYTQHAIAVDFRG